MPPPLIEGCVFDYEIKNPEIQPTSPLAMAGAGVAPPAAGMVGGNERTHLILPKTQQPKGESSFVSLDWISLHWWGTRVTLKNLPK